MLPESEFKSKEQVKESQRHMELVQMKILILRSLLDGGFRHFFTNFGRNYHFLVTVRAL
jgi:hypothetical protein